MTEQRPTIFNSKNFATNYLTLDKANELYFQKNTTNLVIQGNETVQNETVHGNISTSTLTSSDSVTLGAFNSNHTITGATSTIGTLDVKDSSSNSIINASGSAIALGKLPRLTTTITPTDDKDLSTKIYVDSSISLLPNLLGSNNTWTGTNTYTNTVSGITKAMVGLSNVDNVSDSNKPVSSAQQTALNLKSNLVSPSFSGTVSGISKSMVGLSNVDNVSDANKPVSSAQATAIALKQNTITDGSLTIARTANLQSSLDAKQNVITDGSLTVAKTADLQYYLDSKQNVITDGSLTIARTDNLQNSLNLKANLNDPNTFFQTNVFRSTASNNTTPSITVDNLTSNTSLKILTNSGQSAYNPVVNEGSTSIIYAGVANDYSQLNICNWSNTHNGIRLDNAETKLFADTYTTSLHKTAGFNVVAPSTFSQIPKLSSDLSVSDNKHLVSKLHLDNQLNLKANVNNATFTGFVGGLNADMVGLGQVENIADIDKVVSTATQTALNSKGSLTQANTWTQQQTFLSQPSLAIPPTAPSHVINLAHLQSSHYKWGLVAQTYATGDVNYPYGLQAPEIGTYTTANAIGYYKTLYINSSNPEGFGSQSIGLQVYYYQTNCNAITGAIATSGRSVDNACKRATAFTSSEVTAPNSSMLVSSSVFNLTVLTGNTAISPSRIVVQQLQSTNSMYNSATATSFGSTPKIFTSNYKTTSIAMTFNPITFAYILNPSKIQIQIGFANQENSPRSNYWISSLGFDLKLVGGYNSGVSNGLTSSWYFSDF